MAGRRQTPPALISKALKLKIEEVFLVNIAIITCPLTGNELPNPSFPRTID
jgi:hypothetical protein